MRRLGWVMLPVLLVKSAAFVSIRRLNVNIFQKCESLMTLSGESNGSSGNEVDIEAMTLRTLAHGSHVSEMEVKKSRFLGYAKNADDWKQAKDFIEEVKAEHPKGRHWCFGWVAGSNPVQERCSDDGEPTGTAGLPILGAIKSEGLTDTVCVVVRYFGGVKLGAGGLIRAYGASARQVLREAPTLTLIPKATIEVTVDAINIGSVYEQVAKVEGTTSNEVYGNDGSLTATVTCELERLERFKTGLTDATRGTAKYPETG